MLRPNVFMMAAAATLLAACPARQEPTVEDGGVLVLTVEGADPVVARLVGALDDYIPALGGGTPRTAALAPKAGIAAVEQRARDQGAGLVLVIDAHRIAPRTVDPDAVAALPAGGFHLQTVERDGWANRIGSRGATIVLTAGASKLAQQYAVYEVLRRLGARFYHPEQEHLPLNDPRQLRERARTPTAVARGGDAATRYTPDFAYRSYTFHGSHPLEHLEAFSDGNHPIDEAEHVNDWIIKNRGNLFKGLGRGVADAAARSRRSRELEALRKLLGFPRGAGITLHNQQQGASAVVDPSRPEPPRQQIEDYVAARLKKVPDAHQFGIHFGPTEFTVTPDKQTVDWINWAGRKALALKPGIDVVVNDHITGSQAVDSFGDLGCPPGTSSGGTCDYYDLAFHTDKRFAVQVHTVMFYPLEGPARVYNQLGFGHKLCLMKQASAAGRPLVYFPEGSWWLSFDNPIPVYLPLYIYTRGRDVELLTPLLASRGGGTLYAHRMFNSGHEWGYWQQDYAVGLWHWNADATLDQVLGELLDPLCAPRRWKQGCAARAAALGVLRALIEHQRKHYLTMKDWRGKPGGLYAYMAGEDPADEIAAATGFEFRPVRVSFAAVMKWTDKQLQLFRGSDLATLKQMDARLQGWLATLRGLRTSVPPSGLPWLDEIIDGVEVNMLRARQTHQLYDAVLTYRGASLAGKSDPRALALPALNSAGQTLAQVQTVIRRREKSYRYPAAQTHGGGLTKQTAVKNGTTYPWRVHTKTHLLTYWNNRHQQARQILDGGTASTDLQLTPAMGSTGAKLDLLWPTVGQVSGAVTIGPHKDLSTATTELDLGTGEGFFAVSGQLTVDGKQLPLSGGVVRSDSRARTPPASLKLTQPSSALAQSVLKTLFPAMLWATVGGGRGAVTSVAFAPDLEDDGAPSFRHVVNAPVTVGTDGSFTGGPLKFSMPIPNPATGSQALTLGMEAVTLSGKLSGAKLVGPVTLAGELVLEDLIQALIDLAGFDRQGALATLASVLGFDEKSPPRTASFAGELALE